MINDLKPGLLVARGICIHRDEADKKVEAFREWYAELPEDMKAHVDDLREAVTRREIANLGERGVDEFLASVFLQAMR